MTEERVRERLKDLAAFLETPHAVESIDETLEHLQSAVTGAMVQSRAAAQQCTILLFQSMDPPSLLAFLDTSEAMTDDDMRKREITHARTKLYGSHPTVLKKQVVALVTRCQLIARVDKSNKGLAVEVIGHLANRFPSDVEPAYPQLVEWLEDSLDKQFRTNAPEMLFVKGLFFTLSRLLVFETDRYQKLIEKRQKIYSYD
uniref:Uncharacterized protein n=1 Tax=Globisporangium ultimum (strain ATCC 200006 / CBS 805.95 / DAOM BR144) TaxID=431595 RepID=K3WKH6_GLOUD